MPAGSFFGDEPFGSILRTKFALLDTHERIALTEQINMVAAEVAAKAVHEAERSLPLRPFDNPALPLVPRRHCKLGEQLFRRREIAGAGWSLGHEDEQACDKEQTLPNSLHRHLQQLALTPMS